jgi:hypothetical protein
VDGKNELKNCRTVKQFVLNASCRRKKSEIRVQVEYLGAKLINRANSITSLVGFLLDVKRKLAFCVARGCGLKTRQTFLIERAQITKQKQKKVNRGK